MNTGIIGSSPTTVIITLNSGMIIYKYRVSSVFMDGKGLQITYINGMKETVKDVESYSVESEE